MKNIIIMTSTSRGPASCDTDKNIIFQFCESGELDYVLSLNIFCFVN